MIRVKICGVSTAAGFDAAAEAGADWVGFVFFEASPRHVVPAQAAALSARRQDGPKRVGLFVQPTDAAIEQTLAVLRLDVLQLYTNGPRALEIGQRFGMPVWRSVGIGSPADLPLNADADALVIESRAGPGSTRPGGNARRLDWNLLANWRPGFDWLLAGGLRPDNVAAAVAASGATAVDVSSGVETALGVKDPALIAAFIRAARATASHADGTRQAGR